MNTKRLTEQDVAEAARLLAEGQLVGIPTETVYGLGANGLMPEAVKAIFAAKGRPQDNPLILHVPSDTWLERYCEDIPETAYELTRRFWPGPLTLILKHRDMIPCEVTAGLPTVGMRCPKHPVTQAILEQADVPVAAPSANTSGRPSCTTAEDVLEDMDGKIAAVVDGGPCQVGVESTILDLTCDPPRLLRPGGLTLEALEEVLGRVEVDAAVLRPMGKGEKPRAPGMKYRHYAPKAQVTVIKGDPERTAAYIREKMRDKTGILCFDEYVPYFEGQVTVSMGPKDDQSEQARRIFDALRAFDREDVDEILAQYPREDGLGRAVCNRMNKAAGFRQVCLEDEA